MKDTEETTAQAEKGRHRIPRAMLVLQTGVLPEVVLNHWFWVRCYTLLGILVTIGFEFIGNI